MTTADGYISASYNALNQPVGMWSPVYNGTANYMWFGYDPLGRCVKRWKGPASAGTPGYNPATYFYYDGADMVQEGPSAAITDRTYVHGGGVDEIVASQVSGVWYNHHYDAQGNCILLSTASGGLQEQYDYDAFGYPYFYTPSGGKAGNVKTRFLFTGREWISDMKIYDYRARMYQPELGRFLQPDPQEFAAGDYNLYRYCHNDPVNKSDPTGLREQVAANFLRRYSTLTCFGGGDWIKDSNGMSALDFNDRAAIDMSGIDPSVIDSHIKVVGATAPEEGRLRSAAQRDFQTRRGQDAFKKMQKDQKTLSLQVNHENNAHTLGGRQGYEKYEITIDPLYGRPPYDFVDRVDTTAGKIYFSLERIIAHEMGHAILGVLDFGPGYDDMRNVTEVENPIMLEIGEPARTRY